MSFIEKDEALDTKESIFPSNTEKIYFAWWGKAYSPIYFVEVNFLWFSISSAALHRVYAEVWDYIEQQQINKFRSFDSSEQNLHSKAVYKGKEIGWNRKMC